MEIRVNFLDKLRLEARFDDFTVVTDQPIRYKGDASAPSPFDYFLASSALCAGYFVKLYCDTRKISTDNIRLSQNNVVDPVNRYKQILKIQVELPHEINEADRRGILRSIERCSVKRVVQEGPDFIIEEVDQLNGDAQSLLELHPLSKTNTFIAGKDFPVEQTIANMSRYYLIWASRSRSCHGVILFPMFGRYISVMRIHRCVSQMVKALPKKVH